MDRLKAYYTLTKPGIIRGNAVHVIAGSLIASVAGFEFDSMIAVLIGTSLVIASACVANNVLDRDIDTKMSRTKQRPTVTGMISTKSALIYSLLLLVLGMAVLLLLTNTYVVWIGLIAYVMYVFVYGYAKRKSVYGTIVGAIPGALPAMAGYVAVTNDITLGAWLVFLLVFAWQMPHFYAISLFRRKEYAAARIPVLGVVRPFNVVRWHVLVFQIVYLLVIALMITFTTVGPPAGLLLLAGAAYWLIVFARTDTKDSSKWGRSVFGSSLLLTLVLLVAGMLNVFVPPVQ